MKQNQQKRRWISVLLMAAMLAAFAPVDVCATTAETVKGAMETVEVNLGELEKRENNFNKDWKFYLGDNSSASNQNFDDSSWGNVDLPHDFSIFQNFTSSGEAESGFLPGGTGWYRKSFTLPAESAGKTFLLNFDGVYSDAYVYVNGKFVGEHHYGYTSFAIDITSDLVADAVTENVIAVKAVNNTPTSRWYSGSGIYRDVTLLVMDPVHVDLNGTKVTTPNIANGNGKVNVAVEVVNGGSASASVTVKNTVYKKGSDAALATASATVTVAAGEKTTTTSSPVVSNPELWSIENPNLYTVVTEVSVAGTVVDTYETDFGFRWCEFKSTGFYLNGEAVKLNGVCMHHDQGALGSAAYYDAMYRQLSIMKEMGCNAIRTAHNPADEDYIKICSELGLLVIEETFDGLVDPKNGNSNDFSKYFETAADTKLYGAASGMTCAEFAAKAHVKRDRNEPCIIAWSFGNEIQEGTTWNSSGTAAYVNVQRYDEICADYINWVKNVDGTRLVTSGDNNRGANQALIDVINTITNAGGVAGFNYVNTVSKLTELAQNYGGSTGSIIAAETSSAVNSRNMYKSMTSRANADGKYHLTSYDTSAVNWGITAHDSIYNIYQNDYIAGEFVWTGFDYIGEPTPWNGTGSGDSGRGAIPNSSYFGIVDTTGFEKDSYYLYRSQWNKAKTTVHLVTAWDADNQYVENSKTPVWLYSNAPKVEVYLNNKLIATSEREKHVSTAGHTYYTYTSVSKDSACTVTNGSGADGLYAVYNVSYTAGTLYAKAYDESGKEIALDASCGRHTVTTPGTVNRLNATVNKTEIAADGSSLAYITVDVVDANGNLDTTVANNITFTLSGPGEIVGVDNGDQATTKKYQQPSALTSSTNANIDAYGGKALVIVRSTEDAGNITVTAAAQGVTGKTVTVKTVADKNENAAATDLVSYAMVKDYSVKEGTVPKLDTAVTGTLANGTTVNGTIVWNAVPASVYTKAGDYTVNGILTFAGLEPISVAVKLHVIANVVALRNVSTATMVGQTPTLPNVINGVLADGTLAGSFDVTWNAPSASAYDTVGEIVTVTGTAVIFGDETMNVTCSVRVAEAVNTESVNLAPMADSLTQDIAAGSQSDVLSSIINGTLKPGDNTNERWTNWRNRTNSANATLTLTWATAQMVSGVNLYYYYDNCCAYPEKIEFSYSLNGQDYVVISHTAQQVESYSLGAKYSYTFDQPINPVGLKVKFTQKNGTTGNNCVGLTELEVMSYAATFEYQTSADLSAIMVDGNAVNGFAAGTLNYEAKGETVTAEAAMNAAVTVLPEYENVVRILTVAEDGSAAKTYAVTLEKEVVIVCEHSNTTVENAAAATCTKAGYTGDTVCADCGVVVTEGSDIQMTAHRYNDGVLSSNGMTITYTCNGCGHSYQCSAVEKPSVSVSGHKATGSKLKIKGVFEDYENISKYYEVTGHGIIYIQKTKLGNKVLTVNTSGRTRVNISSYGSGGTFSYTFKPTTTSTQYAARAFLSYVDENGATQYVYSTQIVVSYNSAAAK